MSAAKSLLIPAAIVAALVVGLVSAGRREDSDNSRVRQKAAERVLRAVDDAQLCWWERQHRYGATLEDLQLIVGGRIFAEALDRDLDVRLTAATNRSAYAVTISGSELPLYLERRGGDFADFGVGTDRLVGDHCPPEQQTRGLAAVPRRR